MSKDRVNRIIPLKSQSILQCHLLVTELSTQ